jgi:hypothetical protein
MQVLVSNFSGGTDAYKNPTIVGTANYLYWMCGKFALEGEYIISGPGGGSVIPINPTGKPTPQDEASPLEFEVTASSIIPAGASSSIILNYVGYNLLFLRNNIPQSTVNNGGSYFAWDKTNGSFTFSPEATEGELFQLYPFL